MKKLVVLLLCSALLVGLVACTPKTPDVPNETTDTALPEELPLEYDSVLDTYRSILQKKQAGEELSAPDDASDIDTALYAAVNKCTDAAVMGYAYKDLNRDGTDELILLAKDCTLYALLTLKDGAPVLVQSFANAMAEIESDGTVWYMEREEPFALHIKTLQDGALIGTHYYSTDGDTRHYFKVVEGEETEITWDEYQYVMDNESMHIFDFGGVHTTTKAVGFYFRPILETESQEQPPLFTIASYDDVLTAYKHIAQLYPDYDDDAWANGDYESLYTFASQADYELYHALFCSIIGMRPYAGYFDTVIPNGQNAYCYALDDLNGDGTDELVLMLETYEPIAIFTQKDGRPTLLDHYSPGRAVRIDGQGRIIEDRETGGDLGRDSEFYVFEITDGALNCTLGLGAAVNIYLEFEGWYKTDGNTRQPIDQETWETLYASYPELPLGCNEAEYNLQYAGLTLTRLFEAPVASEFHVRDQGEWRRSSYMAPELIIYGVDQEIFFGFQIAPFDSESFIDAVAVPQGDRYIFDEKGFKGEMTVGAASIILTVTACEDTNLEGRTYIFDRIPED